MLDGYPATWRHMAKSILAMLEDGPVNVAVVHASDEPELTSRVLNRLIMDGFVDQTCVDAEQRVEAFYYLPKTYFPYRYRLRPKQQKEKKDE